MNAMQSFRPDEPPLGLGRHLPSMCESGEGCGAGPLTRSDTRIESADGGLRSGTWESEAGTQDFVFSYDEWVFILEGEAEVFAAGVKRTLRAGDAAYFPAGLHMTWTVHDRVRKVWVHSRPPLSRRLMARLRRLPSARGRHLPAVAAVAVAMESLACI